RPYLLPNLCSAEAERNFAYIRRIFKRSLLLFIDINPSGTSTFQINILTLPTLSMNFFDS
ncbi:hypothetical protein, partial [Flavilitoribacter nigricans]|uniref:hypothetical protein n=1 Tax=Flavilitoribacter nigricans TaxID=70997 RepID=UPI001C9E8588